MFLPILKLKKNKVERKEGKERKGHKQTTIHLISVKIPNLETRDTYSRFGSNFTSPFSLE